MLSKTELEFLKCPELFGADYCHVLRHRIRSKVQRSKSDITLLEACGVSVAENFNGVTGFCNGQRGLSQAALQEPLARSDRFKLAFKLLTSDMREKKEK